MLERVAGTIIYDTVYPISYTIRLWHIRYPLALPYTHYRTVVRAVCCVYSRTPDMRLSVPFTIKELSYDPVPEFRSDHDSRYITLIKRTGKRGNRTAHITSDGQLAGRTDARTRVTHIRPHSNMNMDMGAPHNYAHAAPTPRAQFQARSRTNPAPRDANN